MGITHLCMSKLARVTIHTLNHSVAFMVPVNVEASCETRKQQIYRTVSRMK